MKCQLFLNSTRYSLDLPDNSWSPAKGQSRVFYCPFCTSIWGKLQIEDGKYYACREMSCADCNKRTGSSIFPGSLSDALWRDCIDGLPRELLLREYHLHDKLANLQEPPDVYTTIAQQRYAAIVASTAEFFEPIYAAVLNSGHERQE
jgi:hypothetical protein